MKKNLKMILIALAAVFSLARCAVVGVDKEAERIKVVDAPSANCHSIYKEVLIAAPFQSLDRDAAMENLENRARNRAASFDADEVKFVKRGAEGLVQMNLTTEYFACKPMEKMNLEALKYLCDQSGEVGCAEVTRRGQISTK